MSTRIASDCPECGSDLRRRTGKNGDFLGCVAYPRCKFTETLDLNLDRIDKEWRRDRSDLDYLRTLVDEKRELLCRLREQGFANPDELDELAKDL